MKFKSVDAVAVGQRHAAPRARLCYDGEAWERVLAAPTAAPVERARAALSLAGRSCQDRDAALSPAEARAWNDRRMQALQSIDYPAEAALPAALLGRVRLRRAEAFAWRAFDEARRGNLDAGGARRGGRPFTSWRSPTAACSRPRTSTSTRRSRFASRRRAGRPSRAQKQAAGKRAVDVVFAPRGEGETCVRVVRGATPARREPLGERCTYGVVWQSALRWAPSGDRRDDRGPAAGRVDRALGPPPRRRREPGRSRR